MLKSKMLKNKIIILCIYIFSNKICLASTNSISAWNAFTQILNNYVSSYSSSSCSSPSFFTKYNNFISASGQTYTANNYYVLGGSNNKVCIGSATTTTPNCVTFPYTKVKSATDSTLTNQVTINDCINAAQGSDFIYAPNLTLNCGTTGSKCSSPSITLGSAGTCYIDYGNYRGIYIKAYPAFAIKQKDPWDTNSNANTHATATDLADIVSFFPAISKAMQINSGFNPTCTYSTSSNNNMSCASPGHAKEIFNINIGLSFDDFLVYKIVNFDY